MKRFLITLFRMSKVTFDYIAVHLRNNIKKEDNNISNGNTTWATRATNTLLCRDSIRAIVVGQVVATDMLASTYGIVWTRSVLLHTMFHPMLSGRHCAGIVSVACLLVWKQPLCVRMSSILLLCTKKCLFYFFPQQMGPAKTLEKMEAISQSYLVELSVLAQPG